MLLCNFQTNVFVALLGPFQFGIGLAIVNTMLESLAEEMEFDKNTGGAVVAAAIYLGCVLGSFLSGVFRHFCGRYSQSIVALLFLLGSLLSGLSTSWQLCWNGAFSGCAPIMLLIGRILTGIASGITVVISPKYLAEVSLPTIRMSLLTVLEISIVAGVLFGFVIGLPYDFDSFDSGYPWWRIMFLSGCIPALFQLVFDLISVYHSPYARSPRIELRSMESVRAESRLEPESSTREICIEMKSGPSTEEVQASESKQTVPLRAVLHKKYRKSVILGLGVPVVCQLSGTNVLGSYSTIVFEDAGFSQPIIGSVLFGLTNLIFTILTAFIIERFKRRNIAFFSFIGMGVCFVGLALADLTSNNMRGILSVGFVLLYISFFSAGCGPMGTAYAPEVVPPDIAGTVLGIGQSLGRLTDLVLVLTFPEMLNQLGALPAFLIFSFFTFASYFFLKIFMVETKGRELKDIFQELLAQ